MLFRSEKTGLRVANFTDTGLPLRRLETRSKIGVGSLCSPFTAVAAGRRVVLTRFGAYLAFGLSPVPSRALCGESVLVFSAALRLILFSSATPGTHTRITGANA